MIFSMKMLMLMIIRKYKYLWTFKFNSIKRIGHTTPTLNLRIASNCLVSLILLSYLLQVLAKLDLYSMSVALFVPGPLFLSLPFAFSFYLLPVVSQYSFLFLTFPLIFEESTPPSFFPILPS